MQQVVTVTQQQDTLRPLRNFVSLLAGATADQTYADYDRWAASPTGQFIAQNTNGVAAVEGQPLYISASATGQGASLSLSSPALLVGLGLLVYMALK